MSDFTASNGLGVTVWQECVGWDRTRLTYGETVALREFFQHERETTLGWWRSPSNPDLIVMPELSSDAVLVVHERFGGAQRYTDEQARAGGWASAAAVEYFDAHPEPKPREWAGAQFIAWRDGAYLWQTAQRDLRPRSLGWRYTDDTDARWYSEDGLAALIGDAKVTILTEAVQS